MASCHIHAALIGGAAVSAAPTKQSTTNQTINQSTIQPTNQTTNHQPFNFTHQKQPYIQQKH